MSLVTLPNLGPDPFTVNASVLNGKVDPLATDYNGNIQNVNIAAGAGIVYTKLTLTDSILNADINSAAAIAASKIDLGTIAQDINEAKGAAVASATATNIWITDGNYAHITGTTTITSFGTAAQAGAERTVIFDGALTLTHDGTRISLPGTTNITTVANDRAIVRADTTTNAIVVAYEKVSGAAITASPAVAGTVVQVVNVLNATPTSGTTTVPADDSIPQSGEGDEYMTLAITPTSATNKLKIDVVFVGTCNGAVDLCVALFQDATADALACATVIEGAGGYIKPICLTYWMTSGTTSATTFKVRAGGSAATTYFNRPAAGARYGGKCTSSITITEIKV